MFVGFEKNYPKDNDGFTTGFFVSDKIIVKDITFLQTTGFSVFSNGEKVFYDQKFAISFNGLTCFASTRDNLYLILESEEKMQQLSYTN